MDWNLNSFGLYLSPFRWRNWLGAALSFLAGVAIAFITFSIMFTTAAFSGTFLFMISLGITIGPVLCFLISRFIGTNPAPASMGYGIPFWLLFAFWLSGRNGMALVLVALCYCTAISAGCWLCARVGRAWKGREKATPIMRR